MLDFVECTRTVLIASCFSSFDDFGLHTLFVFLDLNVCLFEEAFNFQKDVGFFKF